MAKQKPATLQELQEYKEKLEHEERRYTQATKSLSRSLRFCKDVGMTDKEILAMVEQILIDMEAK